jgi:hypothetical protein
VSAARASQAAAMETSGSLVRRYLGAMNIAAFVTWLAILVLLFDGQPRHFLYTRIEALVCLVAFLAVFMVKQAVEFHRPASVFVWVLLAVEGALALITCVFWTPSSVAPILTIVFMADCGMMLGPRALLPNGIPVNVGGYCIPGK